MTAFIFAGRKKLPSEPVPSPSETYDPIRQLWIESRTGKPLVCCLRGEGGVSQYGETTVTETREGADQTENLLNASPYGETVMTKTHEGADQTEISALFASTYGETTQTATREGIDQLESSMIASSYGETIETRTGEGMDQSEISSDGLFDSGCSQRTAPNLTAWNSGSCPDAPDPHF